MTVVVVVLCGAEFSGMGELRMVESIRVAGIEASSKRRVASGMALE